MSVKPGTVKKFKRLYMNKPTVHSDTTTTIDLLHSSINVLNQVSIKLYSLIQNFGDIERIYKMSFSKPTDNEMLYIYLVF